MKCVILAGGLGTRLSEETAVKPKPMVEIGGRPILWHIIKIYSAHGINDFAVCCGYKGYVIKEYFANYHLHMSDVTFDMVEKRIHVHQTAVEPWRVTLVDTGDTSQTGGRLRRIRDHVKDGDFCLTYGDGVSNIDLTALVAFHKRHGKLATVTAVRPTGRYGMLDIDADSVREFDDMIAGRKDLGFAVDAYDNIVNIRLLRPKLDAARFPQTAAFFSQPFMSEVADGYFGTGNYRLNGEIFVSDLAETRGPQTAPPFALHFDKRQVLKFFVYLTDTDERNGAMRVLPGSIAQNRAARERAMSRGAIGEIPNVLPEPETPSIPVCGPAGTMFIFDTDVCHGASAVQPGFTRRTMRGHTHGREMLKAMGVH